MKKKLMLLFAVAVLAVGFATPAYAAPKEKCPDSPACKDDSQGNLGQSTCNNVFFDYGDESPGDVDVKGPCTDMATPPGSCDLVRFTDNTPGWNFTEPCMLSETLEIDQFDARQLNGNGHELLLVAGSWTGSAAITNSGRHASVRDLRIHVADPQVANCGLLATGLGAGPVKAAISFNPDLGDGGVPGMLVDNVKITVAGNAQFCNAIEIKGPINPPIRDSIHGSSVIGSTIGPDSYSNIGIWVTNFNANDTRTTTHRDFGIENNRVLYSENGCVGIQVGPWVERANIQGNDVEAPGGLGCTSDGVGISVLTTGVGSPQLFLSPLPANIVGNIVDTVEAVPLNSVGISIV